MKRLANSVTTSSSHTTALEEDATLHLIRTTEHCNGNKQQRKSHTKITVLCRKLCTLVSTASVFQSAVSSAKFILTLFPLKGIERIHCQIIQLQSSE